MIELKFNKPNEIYADNDFSGKKYVFTYTIKYIRSGPEFDKEENNKIIISISEILLRRWNYQNEDDLFKIFFYYSFQLIQNKLIEGTLNEVEKLNLKTNTPNVDKKYDPDKIEDFVDKVYAFNLEEIKESKNKIKMGFQISKNK